MIPLTPAMVEVMLSASDLELAMGSTAADMVASGWLYQEAMVAIAVEFGERYVRGVRRARNAGGVPATTRLKGCTVAFTDDIREDDAEKNLEAIRCLRGVLTVRPLEASLSDDWIIEERVRSDLEKKLWAVLRPERKNA